MNAVRNSPRHPERNEGSPAVVVLDASDIHQQTLLVHYPSVDLSLDDYIKPSVKIEAGAKSALDPDRLVAVKPYVATKMPEKNFLVQNVVTIEPVRTLLLARAASQS